MKFLVEIDLNKLGTPDEIKLVKKSKLTRKDIILLICKYFNITYKDLRSKPLKSTAEYAMARKLIAYFLYHMTNITYYEINRHIGYYTKDRGKGGGALNTTFKKLEDLLETKDPQYTRSFNNIKKLLDNLAIK
jgi:hypothetical protein